MTRHAPWEIEGKDPGARTNRPLCVAIDTEAALFYRIRLVETMPVQLSQKIGLPTRCSSMRHNGLKIHLKLAFSEKALEWKENEARKGTPEIPGDQSL